MVLIATVNFTFDAEAVPNIVTPSTVLQNIFAGWHISKKMHNYYKAPKTKVWGPKD